MAARAANKLEVPAASRKRKAGPPATGASAQKKARTPTGGAASTKPAPKKATPAPKKAAPKRKRASDDDDGEDKKRPTKKAASAAGRTTKAQVVLNKAPERKLKVFVFGEGSSGELGLGHLNFPDKKVIDVTRPRLNPNLLPSEVGVVQVAVGGMHCVALTADNRLLTWGVNDQGALGRETKSADQFRSLDASAAAASAADEAASDNESVFEDANGKRKWAKNTGLNALESTPGPMALTNVPEGTVFTQVAAGDSITMVVTSTGLVYGCGTFRSNDGILGFSPSVTVQTELAPIDRLKDITSLVCGDNHVVALDKKGNTFAFGSGQQNQLGRRVVERNRMNGLVPREFGLPRGKVASIGAGAYHSFAIDKSGGVWTWGLNSFGETGIPTGAGDDEATILKPAKVAALEGKGVVQLTGGAHHSLAVTEDGTALVWGRIDGSQSGMDVDDIPKENFFRDANDKINKRLLLVPTPITTIDGKVTHLAAGTDTSLAVTADGKAFSWGFSENYQTGLGTAEDVEEATQINNTATRGEKLVWAGAGGQFSVLTAEAEI